MEDCKQVEEKPSPLKEVESAIIALGAKLKTLLSDAEDINLLIKRGSNTRTECENKCPERQKGKTRIEEMKLKLDECEATISLIHQEYGETINQIA